MTSTIARIATLNALAVRLAHQAALIRNGGRDPRAEARAGKLGDEACAIYWALGQVDAVGDGLHEANLALGRCGRPAIIPERNNK